jgi:hypothetical protein
MTDTKAQPELHLRLDPGALEALETAVLRARSAELGEVRRRQVRLVAGYGDETTRGTMDDEARRAQARYDVLTRLLEAIAAARAVTG